jgi:hypothetical protein
MLTRFTKISKLELLLDGRRNKTDGICSKIT